MPGRRRRQSIIAALPLPFPLLLLLLWSLLPPYYSSLVVLADQQLYGTTVRFYTDHACRNTGGWFSPNSREQAHKSACRQFEEPTRHSVNIAELDIGCSVTIYSDSGCSVNATRVPKGECVNAEDIFSWSLYCGDPDEDPLPSTLPVEPFSKQTVLAADSTYSQSQPLSTSITPALTSSSQAPTSATVIPSAPAASSDGHDNGGLSTAATIAIGVILPTVSIIVAIIFGVRMWNSGRVKRKKGFIEIPLDPTPTTTTKPSAATADPVSTDKAREDGFVAPITPITPSAFPLPSKENHGGGSLPLP